MISYPSDGSVKPPLGPEAIELLLKHAKKADPRGGSQPDMDHEPTRKFMAGEFSGLPAGSTKPEQIARLNESRKWLEQYRNAARDVQRMNDKGEIPDGDDITGNV